MHNRLGHRFQRRLDIPVWLERGPQGIAYSDKVLSYNPLRYWPLWDDAGSAIAEELVIGDNGIPASVTFGQAGIGDGNTSAQFVPADTSYLDIRTAAFAAAFNGAEGTVHVWGKQRAASVWTDGANRELFRILASGANWLFLKKDNANDRLETEKQSGGVFTGGGDGESTLDWFTLSLTWSEAASAIISYHNGIAYREDNVVGVWAGVPAGNWASIGAQNRGAPADITDGYIAHVSFWDTPQPPATILDLATL